VNGYYHPNGGSPDSSQDQDGDQDAEGEDEPADAQPQPALVDDQEDPDPSEGEGSDSEYVDNDASDSDGDLPAGVARRRMSTHARRYAPYASSGTSSGSAGYYENGGYGYSESDSFLFKVGEEGADATRV
jgi:hypothetical protein